MTELIEFLRSRLDEDQTAAAGAGADGPHWRGTNDGIFPSDASRHPGAIVVGPYDHLPDELAEHIARHDPARVLAEVNAKRAILDEHQPLKIEGDKIAGCQTCSWRDDMEVLQVEWPCPTVRLLALPYADHPDYRQEWRP